ncbi:MAG: energy-coupling factor transporter transmembrane protein EcfT [Methanosarcinales archaeon]|nr:energy-coupling factor transporter transmembrane protein EcfT [Methanosarcinales archaeon]
MIGIYRSGHSVLYTLDPRTKLLLTACISLLIYSAQLWGLGFMLVFVFVLAWVSAIPFISFIGGLRPILLFFLVIFLFHLLLTPGELLVSWLPFATIGGLYTGVLLVTRFILLVLYTSILLHTTSPSELNTACAYFLRPLGTFGSNIAFMVGVAVTLIPQLFREKEIIIRAQTARGFTSGGIRGSTAFLVPLLLRSFNKADELSDTLESRCYYQTRRYYYYSTDLAGRDLVAGLIFLVGAGLVLMIF